MSKLIEECGAFAHCGVCIDEIRTIAEAEGSASPKDYARISVGFHSVTGNVIIWCNRHDMLIAQLVRPGHDRGGLA